MDPNDISPGGSSAGKESTCNARETLVDSSVRKIIGERIGYPLQYSWASFVVSLVKNLLTMEETWV